VNKYAPLSRLFPIRPVPRQVERAVLILPCCIGDVVLATAVLKALRRGYPDAHIAWAVGSWSKAALENHPLLNEIIDTGSTALPVRSPGGMARFVRQLRAGHYDLAVSLVRSPLMSAAVWLSGIRHRVGLDSGGRGFGYTVRVPVNPDQPRHEADIYLDTARALKLDVSGCAANVPVLSADKQAVSELLAQHGVHAPYLVVNPAGGRNPGMVMDVKRWPPENFAALADRLAAQIGARHIVLLGGPDDAPILEAVRGQMRTATLTLAGKLTFPQIAALARLSHLYIGNDTGLTHLAAAAGARTVMILGPSDPARYAPFSPTSIALWKPTTLPRSGVSGGAPANWDWARDGLSVDEADEAIDEFVGKT